MDGELPPVEKKQHPGIPFDENLDETHQNEMSAQEALFQSYVGSGAVVLSSILPVQINSSVAKAHKVKAEELAEESACTTEQGVSRQNETVYMSQMNTASVVTTTANHFSVMQSKNRNESMKSSGEIAHRQGRQSEGEASVASKAVKSESSVADTTSSAHVKEEASIVTNTGSNVSSLSKTKEKEDESKRKRDGHQGKYPKESFGWFRTDSDIFEPIGRLTRTPKSQRRLLNTVRKSALRKYHSRHQGKLSEQFTENLSFEYSCSSENSLRPRRPSDVVVGTESCSDEAYSPLDRIRHRRRKRGTALKTQNMYGLYEPHYLNLSGLKRFRLEKYGASLEPPVEDLNIKQEKGCRKKLFHRSVAWARRRHASSTAAPFSFADDSCSPGTPGDLHDGDYFEITSASETEHLNTKTNPDSIGIVAPEKHPTGEERVTSTRSTCLERSTIFSRGASMVVPNENARPRKRPRISYPNFNSLLNVLENDPAHLFGDDGGNDTKPRTTKAPILVDEVIDLDAIKEDDIQPAQLALTGKDAENQRCSLPEVDANPEYATEEDEDKQTITVFEKMKVYAANTFYKQFNCPAIVESESEFEVVEIVEESDVDKKLPPAPLHVKPHFEKYSKGFASKVLKKMGFKGRLGRDENGIVEPLMPQRVSYGAGLGCQELTRKHQKNLDDVDVWISSLAPSTFIFERDMKKIKKRKYKRKKKELNSKNRMTGKRGSSSQSTNEVISVDVEPPVVLPPDNGRRAILVDFDALFFKSHARRLRAFQEMIMNSPEIPDSFDLISQLMTTRGDLCDRDCVLGILGALELDKSESEVNKFLDRLDAAFESGPKLKRDNILMRKLRYISKTASIAFLHYGTERRFKQELKMTGVKKELNAVACLTVQKGDSAPYAKSWQELFLHVAVAPHQSIFLICDHGANPVVSAVGVARGLGARSVVRVETQIEPVPDLVLGFKNSFDATLAAPDKQLAVGISFPHLLMKEYVPERSPRVLAINANEGLWFTGISVYRPLKDSNFEAPVLIKFDRDGEMLWVDPHHVNILELVDYYDFKRRGFPGVLDPHCF